MSVKDSQNPAQSFCYYGNCWPNICALYNNFLAHFCYNKDYVLRQQHQQGYWKTEYNMEGCITIQSMEHKILSQKSKGVIPCTQPQVLIVRTSCFNAFGIMKLEVTVRESS